MAVDGGAGNTISFSEIQTFYGGSNPISLSEYYQGGDEVPGTSSASGTTSQTVNNIAASVSTIATGYTSFSTTITQSNSGYSGNQSSGNWNVIRENSSSGTGSWTARVLNAATTLSGSCDGKALTVKKNGNTVVNLNNSGGSWSVSCSPGDVLVWTCSAGIGGSGTINRSQNWNWGSGGATIQYTANTGGGTSGSVTGYTMTLTNNTGATLNLTSSPWGNDSTFTNGEVKTKIRSSNSWSFSAPGNTNVPTSGTINIDVFNAPGTATP